MIACIDFNGVFTPFIISPEMRKAVKAKGVTSVMLVQYIHDKLASEVGQLPIRNRVLVYDKANIHSDSKVMEAFQSKHVPLNRVFKLPTASAKRASPLDNNLFNEWKLRIRKSAPVTKENIKQLMIDCWRQTSIESIHKYYHNCVLMRGSDAYFDCPNPVDHQHVS